MTTQSRFDLYAFWRTSATYRVRVALNLKGVAASEIQVDLDTGGQRSADFLAINPLGAIPALIDHESAMPEAITQSLAILEFLEESFPAPALLPADLHGRARVRSLAAMLAVDAHPLITPRVKKYLTTAGKFDDAAWRAWQVNWLTTGLQAFEARIAKEASTGKFCHRDSITFADICMASVIVVTRVFKIDVAGIPTIDRIMAACEAHEAFARAAPARQIGAPAGG